MNGREPPLSAVSPILVVDLEVSKALAPLVRSDAGGRLYGSALVLVRLHGEPHALLHIDLTLGDVPAAALAAKIWSDAGPALCGHLQRDRLPVPRALGPEGLPSAEGLAACDVERRRFLADPPELSVLIPTRDRSDRLSRCLDSIWDSAYPQSSYEVVVIDNDPSSDDTRQVVEEHARSHPCRYVREDARGSASARNSGIEAARHELLVFTDDDVRVDEHWLTEIARAFNRAPEVDCVSGLLVPLELETPAQVWFEEYGGFSRGFERTLYDLDRHRPAGNALYPFTAGVFGTGNNMAFRRTALRAIGAFDPALGNGTPALGGVDSEVLLRTVLTGHVLAYEPSALVHHQHRRDYAGLQRQVYAYGTGLTAYLLKTMLANPHLLSGFLRRVPGGLRFALSSGSSKNSRKTTGYPAELTRLELRGMVYGPLAYARSRRTYGPHRTPKARRVRGTAPP